MELKKITRLAMLLGISVILNFLENLFPFFSGIVPGLKIGLANIIILFILYIYSYKDAMMISVLRVIVIGIIQTGLFSINFFFSLGGAILSLVVMALIKKYTKLSMIGVSITGSVFHSLGQVIIAIILLNQDAMIYYLPYLLLFSIPTGIVIGISSKYLIDYTKNVLKIV